MSHKITSRRARGARDPSPIDARGASAARALSALRIGVCAALLLEDSAAPALLAGQMPPALLQWPEGLNALQGPLLALLPAAPSLVVGFRCALGLALLGVFTRSSLAVAAGIGWLVLPLAQLVGPTVHNHHLLWFLTLLALGPSPDRWSVDGLRRRSPASESVVLELELGFARALLGVVYFFPGLWKLQTAGSEWFAPRSMVQLFHQKWYEFGWVPAPRVDRFPELLAFGGFCVLALELAFPLLVWTRRGRWLAAAGGLSFHVFSSRFLGISFAPLWLCYGILIDWDRVLAWLGDEPAPLTSPATSSWRFALRRAPALTLLGVTLLLGAIGAGLRGQMQSWPFACYPTFQWLVEESVPDIVAVWSGDPPSTGYPSPSQARQRSQREWGQIYRLLGRYGGSPEELGRARQEYARQLARGGNLAAWPAAEVAVVELFAVSRPTVPERWNESPSVHSRLGRFPVERPSPPRK